jgi:hypothetical protein
MGQPGHKFDAEFKDAAVRRVVGSSRPASQVARELGIGERTLQRWVAEYRSCVPAEIREVFQATLGDVTLPDPLPLDRRVTIFHEVAECLAEERTSRGIYQVRAGYDGAYFLDRYFEMQSPMLFTTHVRIHEDGRTEELERLETARRFADPDDARREAERIAAHNGRVREILARKGFG